MRNLHRLAGLPQAARNLQVAAGIGSGNHAGTARRQVTNLPLKQRLGLRRLRQGVDARAPAAPRGFCQLDERHARQQTKQSAGRSRHLLSVDEMTGVVVRDGLHVVERRCRRRPAADP